MSKIESFLLLIGVFGLIIVAGGQFITFLWGALKMNNIEQQIDETCELLDKAISELDKKVLEAKLFELVEQLNGNTIYLTVQ